MKLRRTTWRGRWQLGILLVLSLALTNCTQTAAPPVSVGAAPTLPVVQTPTLPPTTVPGSIADADKVAETVRQFGASVSRGDEVVALLVLSPSAQQIVAASDLNAFLGRPERPHAFTVQDVQLDGDVATVECVAGYSDHVQRLRLQLVRLEGVWKIDARVND